jgi:hypothetical protein
MNLSSVGHHAEVAIMIRENTSLALNYVLIGGGGNVLTEEAATIAQTDPIFLRFRKLCLGSTTRTYVGTAESNDAFDVGHGEYDVLVSIHKPQTDVLSVSVATFVQFWDIYGESGHLEQDINGGGMICFGVHDSFTLSNRPTLTSKLEPGTWGYLRVTRNGHEDTVLCKITACLSLRGVKPRFWLLYEEYAAHISERAIRVCNAYQRVTSLIGGFAPAELFVRKEHAFPLCLLLRDHQRNETRSTYVINPHFIK